MPQVDLPAATASSRVVASAWVRARRSCRRSTAWVKFFTPDANWTWYATEAQPEGEDFIFFGLVDGAEKELGYFSLSELQGVRGPMGLPIERDAYWCPKTLREIAPEMFD